MDITMKRFTIFLSVLCLMLSSVSYAAEYKDTEDSQYGEAIRLMSSFGIMGGEDGYFMPGDTLTRADYAELLYNIYNFGNTAAGAYGGILEDAYGDEEKTGKTENFYYYTDVPDYHRKSKYINYVTERGLMQGIEKSKFEPDRSIKTEEAVKTFMYGFGLSLNAGKSEYWADLVMSEAESLGVMDKISSKKGEYVTKGEIAQMIYNCLDLPVVELTLKSNGEHRYDYDEDKTVLTEVFQISRIKAEMTVNSVTSYTAKSTLQRDEVLVGGVRLKYSDKDAYINDYIGHIVTVYYKTNDNDENILLDIALSSKDKSVKIASEDVVSFSDNILRYTKNNSTKTIKIPNGTKMIYNANAIAAYDESTFLFQNGSVEIMQNSSSCDLVIIENYATLHTSGVEAAEERLYSDIAEEPSKTKLEIEEEDICIVLDSNGERKEFSDIAVGDVLNVIRNDGYVKIIISKSTVSGTVSDISAAEGEFTLDEQNEYEYAENYLKCQSYRQIKCGEVITCYLDNFGKVAWIELESEYALEGGYIAKVYKGDDEDIVFKIFRTNGFFAEYTAAEKVTYTDKDASVAKLTDDARMVSAGYKYFGLNADGKINRITEPLEGTSEKDCARCIARVSSGTYRTSSNSFIGQVFIDEKTSVIVVPEDRSAYSDYKIESMSVFVNDTAYTVDGYTTAASTPLAQTVVYYPETSTVKLASGRTSAFVKDIRTGLNEDDELICEVSVEYENKDKVLKSRIDENGASIFTGMANPCGAGSYDLQKGDIIVFSEGIDGYVNAAYIVYSRAMSYPNDAGQTGFLAGVSTDKYYIADSLVDFSEKKHNVYGVTKSSQEKTGCNPYAGENGTPINYAYKYLMYGFRFYVGYVYDYSDGYLTITTQNLRKDSEYLYTGVPSDAKFEDGFVGIYLTESYKYKSFTQKKYVEYYKKTVSIENLDEGQIKSFKKYGNNCSKVLVKTRDGYPQQIFVIEETE